GMLLERVELPQFLAGRRVQSNHAKAGRREVEDPLDDDRGALNCFPLAVLEFAGAVGPGGGELGDVVAVDLIELGVTHPARIVVHPRPVDILTVTCGMNQQPCGYCYKGQAHMHLLLTQTRYLSPQVADYGQGTIPWQARSGRD